MDIGYFLAGVFVVFVGAIVWAVTSAGREYELDDKRAAALTDVLSGMIPVIESTIARHGMFVDSVWAKIDPVMRKMYPEDMPAADYQSAVYDLARCKVKGNGRWKINAECGTMKIVTPGVQ